jgi:hypothetical protein
MPARVGHRACCYGTEGLCRATAEIFHRVDEDQKINETNSRIRIWPRVFQELFVDHASGYV